MGAGEPRSSCLFDIVVRMSRETVCGSRSSMRSWRSEMAVVGGRGNERVGGRPRPGKVVTKTLMFFWVAMVGDVGVLSSL